MNNHIKTSHGIAIIGTCFLITLFFINWAGRQIDSYVLSVPISPSSQIAAVSGAGSGLVAHYMFDGNATDSVNGYTGNAVGGPTYVEGKIGKAVQFDGSNDYVDISGGAATSLNLNNDYTVALWVYLDASPSNHGLLRITKSSSNSAVHDKYGLNLQSLANLRFRTSDGTTPDDDPFTVNLTLGKWAHIVCSLNSSDVKECYKDGVSVGTATNDVDTSLLSPTIGYIGTLKGGAVLSNLLNGRLDDVRIYNRALSASEVSALYSLGGQGGTTDPDPTQEDKTPQGISNINTSNITPNSATVSWNTSEGA